MQSRIGLEYEGSVESFRRKSKITDFQANKRHILRAVAGTLFTLLEDLEESNLHSTRLALFGHDFGDIYPALPNRLVFLENRSDAHVHIEPYVMLGHFPKDVDREDQVVSLVSQLLKERVLLLSQDVEVTHKQQRRQELLDELQKRAREVRQLEAAWPTCNATGSGPISFLTVSYCDGRRANYKLISEWFRSKSSCCAPRGMI